MVYFYLGQMEVLTAAFLWEKIHSWGVGWGFQGLTERMLAATQVWVRDRGMFGFTLSQQGWP